MYLATCCIISIVTSTPILAQSINWHQLSGPHGGAFYSIVSDDDGNVYANTVWGAGPFKSTDNGETWFSIKNGLIPYSGGFHPLAIDSNGHLFIGGAHSTAYLCRSEDGGSSWTPLINLNTGGSSVICISVDKNNDVYVGTGLGIYKSTDNGDNWTSYGNLTAQTEAIAFNDSGHVFAGISNAVYRTTDDGANWTQLPTGGGTRTVAINDSGYIFAGCWENAGILRCKDNGNSWTYVYPQTVSIQSTSTILFDTNGDIYFPTAGKGILKSTNNGDSWIEMNNGLGNKYVRAVARSSTGYLFAGGDYGIYKSTDQGASWNSVGLNICGVKKVAVNSQNNVFAASWGMGRSSDLGQTWETINNGIDNYDIRAILVHNNGDIFAGASPQNWSINNLYRSTNNGESWLPVDGFPLNWDVTITGLALGPNGIIVAVGSGYSTRCHISTDTGLTWTDIRYNLTFGPGEVAINSSGDIFITGGSQGIWRKLAADTIWTQRLTGNVSMVFAASNGHIYSDWDKSTDNGETWTRHGMNTFISSFAENSSGHLFAGTYNYGQGVFRSTDFGETWDQINTGLTIMDVRSLAIDSADYLYAGTWGKSIFKTTNPTVTSVEDIMLKPISFTLSQNYPNPFNPTTTIQFDIPKASFVTLKVYNLLGQEVAALVNEKREAGRYEVEFDGSKLTSGVYFYRLQAGEYAETRKLLFMK